MGGSADVGEVSSTSTYSPFEELKAMMESKNKGLK
jgi:hypothetical protein